MRGLIRELYIERRDRSKCKLQSGRSLRSNGGVNLNWSSGTRPILSVDISPVDPVDREKLQELIAELARQDPSLQIRSGSASGPIALFGMSEAQLEAICRRIEGEFHLSIEVAEPSVIYLETIREFVAAEGRYIRRTGGLGNYGHILIWIEPNWIKPGWIKPGWIEAGWIKAGESTDDLEIFWRVPEANVPAQYADAVERGIREAAQGGVLAGHEIAGVKITAYDGSHDATDSNEMAFTIAASMAFKDAARKAAPIVLEPTMLITATATEALMGAVISDLNARRGRIDGIRQAAGLSTVTATAPLSELLMSSLHGRPDWRMEFVGYEPLTRPGRSPGDGAGGGACSQSEKAMGGGRFRSWRTGDRIRLTGA